MTDETPTNETACDLPSDAVSDGENGTVAGAGGDPGRDATGRFTSGNGFASGNPYAKRVNEFRSVLFAAVSDEDLREIAETLRDQAKAGNLDATKILFDRLLGRPTQHNVNENHNHDDAFTVTHELRQKFLENDAAVEILCSSLNVALYPQASPPGCRSAQW